MLQKNVVSWASDDFPTICINAFINNNNMFQNFGSGKYVSVTSLSALLSTEVQLKTNYVFRTLFKQAKIQRETNHLRKQEADALTRWRDVAHE